MSNHSLTLDTVQFLFGNKIREIVNEPDFTWKGSFRSFMTDGDGNPVVRVKMANCHLDTDIWEGLRSPASVGMYPLTFQDIWTHWAAMDLKSTRPDGSCDPLRVPETFEAARKKYHRVVIICGMLAMNPDVYKIYSKKIKAGDEDPFDYYGRATSDSLKIIDKAVAKTALALMKPGRVVVPMTNQNVERIISRTRCDYHTGQYHGPCNDHWSQMSIAVVTGLLKFGVSRLPFRDEIGEDGKVRRLFGRYRSIVVFDDASPVEQENGTKFLDGACLKKLIAENDYRDTRSEVVKNRYCTYNVQRADGRSVCAKCIEVCPSGAQANSAPDPKGIFPERLKNQIHRFKDGFLDFDDNSCYTERSRKAQIYDDYVCARCESICATHGIRKSAREIKKLNEPIIEGDNGYESP
jgi:hypothetical protein